MCESLSEREREVVLLCAFGFRYSDIADRLCITSETVRTHIKHICSKLHARNAGHAAIIALWRGELSLREIADCETEQTPAEAGLVNQEA